MSSLDELNDDLDQEEYNKLIQPARNYIQN